MESPVAAATPASVRCSKPPATAEAHFVAFDTAKVERFVGLSAVAGTPASLEG